MTVPPLILAGLPSRATNQVGDGRGYGTSPGTQETRPPMSLTEPTRPPLRRTDVRADRRDALRELFAAWADLREFGAVVRTVDLTDLTAAELRLLALHEAKRARALGERPITRPAPADARNRRAVAQVRAAIVAVERASREAA